MTGVSKLPEFQGIPLGRAEIIPEGISWINDENFDSEWIHYRQCLATFTGVKQWEDTLLSRGYFLIGLLHKLVAILSAKHGKSSLYTSAFKKHLDTPKAKRFAATRTKIPKMPQEGNAFTSSALIPFLVATSSVKQNQDLDTEEDKQRFYLEYTFTHNYAEHLNPKVRKY
ncbi:Hypothetical protein POVR1_LOCUS168 [uncultured virus]|nr:Hypothetical protein POVR1_LOCUS168 [uncultured virus]